MGKAKKKITNAEIQDLIEIVKTLGANEADIDDETKEMICDRMMKVFSENTQHRPTHQDFHHLAM